MTASTEQPRVRRERRIIERPRLIKLLDESEARVILLLAPAGYGKTTLARQWAKTLNGAIWVSLTPAHRDIARFAEDVAVELAEFGGEGAQFIREYLRARGNPQRDAREIGSAISKQLEANRVQWVALDDYHEVAASSELADLINVLEARGSVRFLIASRVRPDWATRRRVVYGEICEIGRDVLAMDEGESGALTAGRRDLDQLRQRAEGWPAVLGLAVATTHLNVPGDVLSAHLYEYIADELFNSVPAELRAELIRLALAPELALQDPVIRPSVVEAARELGFLSSEQQTDLHPLIREFLLQKLDQEPQSRHEAECATQRCIDEGLWDRSIELIERFGLVELIEKTMERAYKPLARSGQVATLSTFGEFARVSQHPQAGVIHLTDAEVALRDGRFKLAFDLATRALDDLPEHHDLASRANLIIGQCLFSQGDHPRAESCFRKAFAAATDDQDEAEALYSWALTIIQGELSGAEVVLDRLAERRSRSALDSVRHGTVEIARARFGGRLTDLDVEDSLRALLRVGDPKARSSLTFSLAYALAIKAEYRNALTLAIQAREEVDSFDLEFARPHSNWNLGLIYLGLRRFGAAERCLQLVEDASRRRPLGYHVLNARILRARLALQTGELDRALAVVNSPVTELTIPSLHGEFHATRALAQAAAGEPTAATESAIEAMRLTTAAEVHVLAQGALAVADETQDSCEHLFEMARRTGAWDPAIAALRVSDRLCKRAATNPSLRSDLEALFERSNDSGLARRSGIRTRSTRSPEQLLSPRELEVLGLLARGFRNRDVARALVISESTTKVHVRHILEKLGVRTRAAAVARYGLFSADG